MKQAEKAQRQTDRLVILSDYGLDDAAALAYILGNRALFGEIDVVAIAGNTSAENSLLNAKKLLSNHAPECLHGVRLVDTTAEKQYFCTLPSIHGNDGMGDILQLLPLSVPVIPYKEFEKSLSDVSFTLFSLGPCTLTKRILEIAEPKKLVLMAGVIEEEPNYEGLEFNQALDVAAFNDCVKHAHVIATLDTCRAPLFNLADRRKKEASLLNRLINRAEELAEARHPDNCYIYDYIAAHYLTRPEIFDIVVQTDKWGNKLFNLRVKAGETW